MAVQKLPLYYGGPVKGTTGTFSSRVTIKLADDVDLVGVSGAAIFGGDGTATHIAIDGNEIMAKLSATAAGTLGFNLEGGTIRLGSASQGVQLAPGVSFQSQTAGAIDLGTASLPWGSLFVDGEIISGVNTVSQITANQNDFDPGTNAILLLDIDAGNRDITGFSGGTDGRILLVSLKATSGTAILKHQNASSTAANRFALPNSADVTLGAHEGVTLWYDGDASRWKTTGVAN